jgi:predicted MPP superfamily phosphohydrolase
MTDDKQGDAVLHGSAPETALGRCYRAALAAGFVVLIVFNFYLLTDWLWRPHSTFEKIRICYNFNTLYFPPVPAALGVVGLLGRRRWRERATLRWAGIALVLGVAPAMTRVWATHIEPRMIRVRRVTLTTTKLDRPLRILHISDTQSDYIGEHERRAVATMRELKPDIVFHTGDLAQPLLPATYESELPKMGALLETLEPPLGKFIAGGDTDYPSLRAMSQGIGGMRLLENKAAVVELGGGRRLRLFGLTNDLAHQPNDVTKEAIGKWMSDVAPEDFSILFGHAPDFALVVREMPIDLCLAGHTHGGQIRIPGFGPIMTMSSVPRDWARGWRRIDLAAGCRTYLNVSAGLGAEHLAELPSIRLFCPPEMTLIEVVPGRE